MLQLHLLNTRAGLLSHVRVTLGTGSKRGFIDAVPRQTEEVIRVDGYSRLGILVRVVVPLCIQELPPRRWLSSLSPGANRSTH
jgi:ABC-type glycerol-3-phosphate transport system permease component